MWDAYCEDCDWTDRHFTREDVVRAVDGHVRAQTDSFAHRTIYAAGSQAE